MGLWGRATDGYAGGCSAKRLLPFRWGMSFRRMPNVWPAEARSNGRIAHWIATGHELALLVRDLLPHVRESSVRVGELHLVEAPRTVFADGHGREPEGPHERLSELQFEGDV